MPGRPDPQTTSCSGHGRILSDSDRADSPCQPSMGRRPPPYAPVQAPRSDARRDADAASGVATPPPKFGRRRRTCRSDSPHRQARRPHPPRQTAQAPAMARITDALIVSVSEFAARLKGVFRTSRRSRGWRERRWNCGRGHGVGTLKDANAVLDASRSRRLPRRFGLGERRRVTAFGSVEIKVQAIRLLVTDVQLTGQGELHQKYLALKQQFATKACSSRRAEASPTVPVARVDRRAGRRRTSCGACASVRSFE